MNANTIPRLWDAMDGAHCKTGPRQGRLKAKCPPMGTDAAIYWLAAVWEANPYRASIAMMAAFTPDQQQFFDAIVADIKRSRAKAAA